MAVKYVFVTGGVVSGLGKGYHGCFSGTSFENARGYSVTMQKVRSRTSTSIREP